MGSIARRILKNAGSRVEVYVTAADADRETGLLKFWTQLDPDDLERVEQLAESFQFIAQESPSPMPDLLAPGCLCIAKYLEDNRWYRAQIESVTGNDVIAFFIDYGNTEIIPRNLVRMKASVGDDVFAIPGQATECVLAGVVAVMQHRHIKMGTHGYLQNSLVDQTFTGEPLQLTNDGLEMKLFTESGDSVAEKFILDDFGERRGPGVPLQDAPAAQKQVSVGYTQSSLAVGSCQNLYISNVASLSQFWVQPASKSQELDNLMDSISAQYDGLGPREKALGAAQLGSPCVVMFSEDEVNYRAVVSEVQGPNRCTVQFVDFGNSEVKDSASLKAITDDLLRYPVIAVECSLSGVSGQSTSPAAVERFEELTAEKELSGKVVGMSGNACSVLLLDPQGEENADIVSVLVKEGLASRSTEQYGRGAKPGAFNGSGDAGAGKSFVDPRISQGSRVVVEIIAIRGIDDFSCQLMEDAEAFNAMMDRLQADYSATPSKVGVLRSPTVGQPCCVRFGEDNCWYRALVVSVNGRQIRVQYVDYGNGEVVDASKLMQLKAEFLALPLQCIDCCLDGVPALEGADAQTAMDWLDKHTEENFVATVTSVRGGKFALVLKSEETGMVLNDEIKKILPRPRMEKKVKSPPRSKPPPEDPRPPKHTPPRNQALNSMSTSVAELGFWSEVKLGAAETDVYISHVEDPGKFFCQLVSQEVQLNLLMDDIHNKCMDSKLKRLQRACVGTPCVAQFSEDNSWYRGVIKDQQPGRYRVCFVDYGNEEEVPLDKVCEITADLMTLPQQAAACCLSGWDPTWREDKVTEHMKTLAAEVEKFRLAVRESKGASVVQLKWQGRDMLSELKKVRESIPKEVKQPTKTATPPRQKDKPASSPPPFTLASAAEDVKVDQRVMIAASVAKGPTKFFCQLCSSYDQLQGLSAEMSNHYSASQPRKDPLASAVRGTYCAAQSSSDGAWYRAKILHEVSPGKVKVRFVDYGDDDVVAAASLCTLLPKFRKLPAQAIKCRLSGVMQKFESVVIDQEVMATVKSKADGKLEIEYVDDAFNAKVREILGPVVAPVQVQEGSPKGAAPQKGFSKQATLGGTEHDVYVSHVDNLQKFYVQMCSRSDEIDMLQQKLRASYGSDTGGPPSSAAEGTPCCAKFSEDGDWYRAAVVGSPSPGRVAVQFVDFGNSEEQSASDLRILTPEFFPPTVGAVECRLKDVSSSSLDIANEFLDLTVDKSMKCTFHGGEEPYEVQFPDLQGEVKKWQQTAAQEPVTCTSSLSCPAPKTLRVGAKEEVYISSATSPASFWCQLAQHEGILNELMDSIDAHYSSLAPGSGQMRSPSVGAVCIAQFAGDGGWYRAQVTEVRPDACMVTFIDYGNADTVPKSLIMDIKEDFLVVEQQAMLCSLGGVGPVGTGWSEEASDSFLNLTEDKKLLAEVVEVELGASSHQVTLLDLGISLGQSLIDAEHARAVPVSTKAIRFASESDQPDSLPGFEKLNITQGSTEKVYVTVVNSLHEFYCQLATRATEDLDPLSEKLQAEAPSLENLQAESIQGLPCVAKFSDDEQWYRATILADNGDQVDVLFVDYGNKESVPRDQVKALTHDFSALPAQAVKCALARVPESSASDDTAVAEFENAVLEGEALTAEFVSRKGNAWVIQLLNNGEPVAEALGIKLQDKMTESVKPVFTQRSLSYSWTPLKERQVVEVFVTAVSSPEDFWCQFAKSEDDLNIVMDNIQSSVIPMGENSIPQDIHWRPSHACLAQCAQDGFWYRSEVTEVVGDAVKVLFVDTGKTETISTNKVRAMEADFLELPRQSLRCRLASVSPKQQTWDQDATDAFKRMSSDHSLMAEILKVVRTEEGGVTSAVVSLLDGAVSLSDLLVGKDLATALEVPHSAEQEVGDVVEQVLEAAPWEGRRYEQPTLLSGERQEVVVLSVVSPSEFYCRAADCEEGGTLAEITSEVERHVKEMIGTSRLVPAKGMPCVAKCQDGTWRRAEILDVFPSDKVRIFQVDQAQMREVSVDNLQLITSSLLALPPQAVMCSLGAASSSAEWSEADTLAFKELVNGKMLQAELGEGGVELFDREESVLQTLVQKAKDRNAEMLAAIASSGNQPEGLKPEVEVSEEEDKIFKEGDTLTGYFKQAFGTLDLTAGQEVTLCLVTVNGPEKITCQIDHEEQKVLDIEQRMTNLYAENTQASPDVGWVPKVGEPCAAKHSEYDDWYRATVVSVDQELGVEVYYADYGGTDQVLLESVRELTDDLKRLPAQAMRFCLTKPLMPLAMWNKKTKAIMEGQDTERDVHATVVEVQDQITVIDLAEEDHTFLTHLVDQSQTSSLDNGDEDGDRDAEFFDAVDQASTEGDDAYEVADADRDVRSLLSEAGAVGHTPDDVQSSVAAVLDNLFEKAAGQATANQEVSEVQAGDTPNNEESQFGLKQEEAATERPSFPPILGGSRMISMKDILDQFVDHTLQNLNKDENAEETEQIDDREEEEDDEDDRVDGEGEIQEAVNGDSAVDEESSETDSSETQGEVKDNPTGVVDGCGESQELEAQSLPDNPELGREDQLVENDRDSDKNQDSEVSPLEPQSEKQAADDEIRLELEEPKDGSVVEDQPPVNLDSEATGEEPKEDLSPDSDVVTERASDDQNPASDTAIEEPEGSLEVDTAAKDDVEDPPLDPQVVTERASDDQNPASDTAIEEPEGSLEVDTAAKDDVEDPPLDPQVVTERASDDQNPASDTAIKEPEGSLEVDTARKDDVEDPPLDPQVVTDRASDDQSPASDTAIEEPEGSLEVDTARKDDVEDPPLDSQVVTERVSDDQSPASDTAIEEPEGSLEVATARKDDVEDPPLDSQVVTDRASDDQTLVSEPGEDPVEFQEVDAATETVSDATEVRSGEPMDLSETQTSPWEASVNVASASERPDVDSIERQADLESESTE